MCYMPKAHIHIQQQMIELLELISERDLLKGLCLLFFMAYIIFICPALPWAGVGTFSKLRRLPEGLRA
jgi:hypothetical protein